MLRRESRVQDPVDQVQVRAAAAEASLVRGVRCALPDHRETAQIGARGAHRHVDVFEGNRIRGTRALCRLALDIDVAIIAMAEARARQPSQRAAAIEGGQQVLAASVKRRGLPAVGAPRGNAQFGVGFIKAILTETIARLTLPVSVAASVKP